MTFDFSNSNLSDRTDVCLTSFRAAAGADGICLRTETHWPRALPAKHQFVKGTFRSGPYSSS